MKKLVKLATPIIFALSFATNLYSLDFGALLKDETGISTQTFDSVGINQQASFKGWLQTPITADEKMYFSTEFDLTHRFTSADLSNPSKSKSEFYLNLPLCKLTYFTQVKNGILQVNAGRFFVNDSTYMVLSQEADGGQVTFSSNLIKAIAYAGYTGLTNARYNAILDGPSSKYKQRQDIPYILNSSYIVAGLSFATPYLFKNQTIGLEVFGMIGVAENFGYNRFYITALLNGPLIQNLFYSLSSTFGIGEGVSNLSKLEVTYYPPFHSATIAAEFLYASGNNGSLTPFVGFSSKTAFKSYDEPEYTGFFKAGIKGTIRPVENLYCGLNTDVIFSCENNFAYSGIQCLAQVQFQIYTDLSAGLSASQFIGSDFSKNNTSISLNVEFAF